MQPSPLCSSRTLPSPQKETLHPSAVSPHPPLTAQPLASTSLWFCPWLWIYPFWAFPNRRSPITCSLWCLAFFIQRDVFRVRPHCSKDCSTLSSADGNLGVFHLLANRVVVNACVQVSVWIPVFKSLGFIPRSGIWGLYIFLSIFALSLSTQIPGLFCVVLCCREGQRLAILTGESCSSCGRFARPVTALCALVVLLVWGF